MATCARVLSVQSHVVHGYVGNKSAVFPLQLLGIEVDFINSVQFSNHTGYGRWKGQTLNGDELWNLIEGLESNDLIHYTHLLTGYIGSASFLQTIVRTVQKLKEKNPDLVYFCDPVMGDDGKLYVPQELVALYREELVPLATVLTPNQTECELLTGIAILNDDDALASCAHLHAKGVKTVVLTSVRYADDSVLYMIASQVCKDGARKQVKISVPRIPHGFTGTGDLTAALLLAYLHEHQDIAVACEKAVAAVQAVIHRTYAEGKGELQLIQSKRDIEDPQVTLRAVPMEPTGSAI
eukprot:GILK01005967.1.p1 GENE.GILK01005967.1~~GILK01005967.1.p1  ORF type:complete len:306 (-),score=45.66 GILK01005967.1:205-1089(-)